MISAAQTNIYFESGSDKLDAKAADALRQFVTTLPALDVAILIAGFTDSTGTNAQNEALVLTREASVRNELLSLGIKPEQLGQMCATIGLPNQNFSNAGNRRVELSVQKLSAYTAKNGMVIYVPDYIGIKLREMFYKPGLVPNGYRYEHCKFEETPGKWYVDVLLGKSQDSCRFLLVKVPREIVNDNFFVAFSDARQHWKNTSFQKKSSTPEYDFFHVPMRQQTIALDQGYQVICGYTPMVSLKIEIPRKLFVRQATIGNDCIKPILLKGKRDTLTVDYEVESRIDWRGLNLTVRTTDTIYTIPLSAFTVTTQKDRDEEDVLLTLPADYQTRLFPPKHFPPKKRTFWQRLRDWFR